MEEEIIDFEFNKETLKDFDNLMTMHLDKIVNLTISGISTNPNFYNVIGLCINLKTLKIVGDLKINTNNVFSNILKPESLEEIIFDGVRLPTIKSISKFTNLKSIQFYNIKYSSIKGFLSNVSKENIEELIFKDTDFCKADISVIKEFTNIRNLELVNCENCRFDSFEFLATNRYLDNVVLDPVLVNFDQLSNFIKGKSTKKVNAQLGKTTKKNLINHLYIDENEFNVIINSKKLKELSENINFNRIDKLVLKLDKDSDLTQYMKLLRRIKQEVIISIKDLSYLSVDDISLLKEQLNIKKIQINNIDEDQEIEFNELYDVDEYVEMRNQIEQITNTIVNEDSNELDKIVNIYKAILSSKKKSNLEIKDDNKISLNSIIQDRYSDFAYAVLLENCLLVLDLVSKIIEGEDENGKHRYWNQVKVYDNWYNADLYLDSQNISKHEKVEKRPKYFLIMDKEFYKNHKPKSCSFEHCVYEIDKKIINSYFKYGEDDFEVSNKSNSPINKIKKLFVINKTKTEEINAVTNDKQNYSNEEIDLLNKIDDLDDFDSFDNI